MNNENPQRSDEKIEQMQQEVARQQIAAEQAEQNARFLAMENNTLRTRVIENNSNGPIYIIGALMAVAAVVAAFLFMNNSAQETRQQAEATRMEAQATRLEATNARTRANTALDTANRAGLRSQDASAAAQQANSAALRAEQNAQRPTVILTQPAPSPAPPTIIVTPAEPDQPLPATEIPDNPDPPKPLEGRIE